jgi:hypothetical protein
VRIWRQNHRSLFAPVAPCSVPYGAHWVQDWVHSQRVLRLAGFATIGQAVEYMTSIGRKRELRSHWQWIARLISLKRTLELALFHDAKLDVSKIPAQ